MPGRKIPLVTDQIYHVFNKGIESRPIFLDKREHERALLTINYYHFKTPPIRLAYFLTKAKEQQQNILCDLRQKGKKVVEIMAYCLMPNHFHLLLRQKDDGGIAKFMANFQNSYTRYFNIKHKRKGSLVLNQFKAVRIEDDAQLLHVSRYIHLNPHTAYVVKTLDDLKSYSWSSLSEYLNRKSQICQQDTLNNFFKDSKDFWQFIVDQADYQRQLDNIKHLLLEK